MRSSARSGRSSHAAQQAPTHDGHRAIDLVEQRSGGGALATGHDFQVLQRDRIDDEAVRGGPVRDGADVREIGLLRGAQIGDESARRLDGRRPPVEPEALEGHAP